MSRKISEKRMTEIRNNIKLMIDQIDVRVIDYESLGINHRIKSEKRMKIKYSITGYINTPSVADIKEAYMKRLLRDIDEDLLKEFYY